ncbi:MAG: glycosyltransferase family 2 protein [Bacteroidota bacterium]
MSIKISLITVCYNAERTIEKTIQSVLGQKYASYEYIIIDGNSKDGTLSVIENWSSAFNKKGIAFRVTSENDMGLYDAMNKGIRKASGSWIWFLNADDFLDENAFSAVIESEVLEQNMPCGVYGKMTRFDNGISYVVGERHLTKNTSNITFNHAATLIHRDCFNQFGVFDIRYRFCADYELFTRFVKNNVNFIFLPKNLAYMRGGGVSDKFSNYFNRGIEHYKIDYQYYSMFRVVANAVGYFGLGFIKKAIKDALVKLHFSHFVSKFYKKKYGIDDHFKS